MKKANRAPAYACIYHGLAEVARKYGYALAIHGSVITDLDLIAVPWTDDACDMETVVNAIVEHCGKCDMNLDAWGKDKGPATKPHGRMAWKLHLHSGGAVDLSVTPKLTYLLPPGTDDRENNEYLIARLERVIELINEGNNHMAVAKLLADISALRSE